MQRTADDMRRRPGVWVAAAGWAVLVAAGSAAGQGMEGPGAADDDSILAPELENAGGDGGFGPLGGPAVAPSDAEGPEPESMVRRKFDGTVELPRGAPEEAALARLALSDAEREAVEKALNERAAVMDGILVDNLPLMSKFANGIRAMGGAGDQASGGGRTEASRRARREFLEVRREVLRALTPMYQRGTLRREIADALGEDNRSAFMALMDEYDAGVLEQMRKAQGDRFNETRARRQIGPRSYFAEVRSSADRVLGQRSADFREFMDKLDLRPELAGKVEAIVQRQAVERSDESGEEPGGDRDGLRRVLQAVFAELEAGERREVLQALARVRAQERGDR